MTTSIKYQTKVHFRCGAIIVAHNHPSGGLEPSPHDIEVTSQLKEAGAGEIDIVHQVEFPDNSQRTAGVHERFVAATGHRLRLRQRWQNRRWRVEAWQATG